MKLFHRITVFGISEKEKADFRGAGIDFKEFTRGPRGECGIFEIGEDDPRWKQVSAVIASLEGRGGIPKEYRAQSISMTESTMEATLRQAAERIAAATKSQSRLKWLNGYSGQSVEQLLSLEGEYRTESLVLAFEEAINLKAQRNGAQSLTDGECIVLAVEALEREVNNGGYHQFFVNSSRNFAPTIVDALQRIGCEKTATITQSAIKALAISDLTPESIEVAISRADEESRAKLNHCDDSYYKSTEPIAERLFAFIKVNRTSIGF